MSSSAETPNRPWTKFYPVGVRKTIDEAPHPHLAAMVRSIARTYADRPAYTLCLPNGMGGTLTYAEVDRWSDAFAVYLREVLKLKPGARVALQTPNALAFPIVAYGVFKAGLVLININPLYTAEEMGKVFADGEPDLLVLIDMFAANLPAALAIHKVPNIVVTSITDFMPFLQGTLVGLVQKYKDKSVQPVTVPHTTFRNALKAGEAAGHFKRGLTITEVEMRQREAEARQGGPTGPEPPPPHY